MNFSRWYRSDPEIDDGKIDGRVEPIAWSAVAPRARMAGVDMTAPPMPNMPDSTPVTTPTSTVIAISSHSGTSGKVLAVGDLSRELHGATRYARRMASDLDLRGVWIPLITPF